MGILAEPLQYVRDLALPKGFSVCELGDQWITTGKPHRLAMDFYKEIGAGRYMSIDGNGRGTLTWDLNKPITWVMEPFDLVTDFGTGQHVFDQGQVWRTIHWLTKPGGYIAFDRPCAGYEGHCFYLIQPNLIAAIVHANDYQVMPGTFKRVRGRGEDGELIRGVLRKPQRNFPFATPQQGRYWKGLGPILTKRERVAGPDHKSADLRRNGLIRRGTGPVEIET